jgi:hypothetical protein
VIPTAFNFDGHGSSKNELAQGGPYIMFKFNAKSTEIGPRHVVASLALAWGIVAGGNAIPAIAQDTDAENVMFVQEMEATPLLPIGMLQFMCSGPDCGTPNINNGHWFNIGPVNEVHFSSDVEHTFNLDDPRYAEYISDNGEIAYVIRENCALADVGETSLEKEDVIVGKDIVFILDNGV